MKKRIVLFLISFSLIVALIYVSNPGKIADTLSQTNLIYILLALTFWFIGSIVRTGRWDYLLRRTGIDVNFPRLMKYYICSMSISNLSPAKTGDPVRAVFLKKIEKESFSKGLGSIFAERIFDIITLALISLISLWMLAAQSLWIKRVYLAIGIYALFIFFGLYLAFSPKKLEWFLGGIVSLFSFIPKVGRLEDKLESFSKNLRKSLKIYGNPLTILISILFSSMVWIMNSFLVKMVFLSLGLDVSFLVILATYSTGILVGLLTLLPGALGSSEIIQVSLYGIFLTFSVSTLTSIVLLTRLTNFFVYVILGAVLLSTLPEEVIDF